MLATHALVQQGADGRCPAPRPSALAHGRRSRFPPAAFEALAEHSTDHNVIAENAVSGNGGDEEAQGVSPPRTGIEILSNGSFPGFGPAAPIVGTIIAHNEVFDEDVDVWVGNTATDADVFLNELLGSGAIGVENGGSGRVVAIDDWWGCSEGPGAPGCSSTSGDVLTSPFLRRPVK